MARDLKYFMRSLQDEIVTVPGPDTIKDEEGNVINLEIRMLPQARIREINDFYRKRSIATDKRGQPYISNGEVVYRTERDNERATRHIIVEALAYPDLKDKDLMAFYNCVDVTEMPLHVFSRVDEYAHVSRAVLTALGILSEPADEAAVEDAKN